MGRANAIIQVTVPRLRSLLLFPFCSWPPPVLSPYPSLPIHLFTYASRCSLSFLSFSLSPRSAPTFASFLLPSSPPLSYPAPFAD